MKPNKRESNGETADGHLAKTENMLRITENAAEHETGESRERLLKAIDHMNVSIDVAVDPDRITKISSNFMRAQQAEDSNDERRELRHLLWAASDMADLLQDLRSKQKYPVDYPDMRKSYAVSLHHTAARIMELVCKGV